MSKKRRYDGKFLTEGSPEELLERSRKANDMTELGDQKLGRSSESLDTWCVRADRNAALPSRPRARASRRAPGSLRRVGKGTWRIQFGESDVQIRHSVGLWRYAQLLARPREEVEAAELARLTRDSGDVGEVLDSGEVGDALEFELATRSGRAHGKKLGLTIRSGRARRERIDKETAKKLKEVWSEIQKLEKERDHLLRLGDEEAAARVDEQAELKRKSLNLVAFDGRERDDSGPAEKARKAVTNSLAYAREKLREEVPGLAEYLLANVRPAGTAFIFWPPDEDPRWEIDPGDF